VKFDAADGQFVELKILDYEFPGIAVDRDDQNWFKDSNWLMVYINVKLAGLCWDASAPVLNIYDVRWLADWFRDLSGNKKVKRSTFYFEPELSFDLRNRYNADVKKIRINFRLRFNPAEVLESLEYTKRYSVLIRASNEQLRLYAEDLERELEKYPER
jgi:hypothetical protein